MSNSRRTLAAVLFAAALGIGKLLSGREPNAGTATRPTA